MGTARMARDAGVEMLVLVHHGAALDNESFRQEACSDAESIFDDEVTFAGEGFTLEMN